MPQTELEKLMPSPYRILSLPFQRKAFNVNESFAGDLYGQAPKLKQADRLLTCVMDQLCAEQPGLRERLNWAIAPAEPRDNPEEIAVAVYVTSASGESLPAEELNLLQKQIFHILNWHAEYPQRQPLHPQSQCLTSGDESGPGESARQEQGTQAAGNAGPDPLALALLSRIAGKDAKLPVRIGNEVTDLSVQRIDWFEPLQRNQVIEFDAEVDTMQWKRYLVHLIALDKQRCPVPGGSCDIFVGAEMYQKLLTPFVVRQPCRVVLSEHVNESANRVYELKDFAAIPADNLSLFS